MTDAGITDYELGKLFDALDGDYTVMVFSDPNEFKAYEPEFSQPVHMDMKRWTEEVVEEVELVARKKSNGTTDHRPLFEKYQFFTPGKLNTFLNSQMAAANMNQASS